MKGIFRLAGIALVFAATQSSAMYKCEDENGRMVFSQTPCSPDAQEVSLDVVAPSEAEAQAAAERAAAQSAAADEAVATSGKRLTESQISTAEDKIRRLQRERDAKIAANNRKAERANNNLAGATWEGSLAAENQAIAEQYGADIKAERSRITDLRSQLRD